MYRESKPTGEKPILKPFKINSPKPIQETKKIDEREEERRLALIRNRLRFESKNKEENPYKESSLVAKIRDSKRIAFLDIDSTLTGNPDASVNLRKTLEQKGYAVVFVTSRTEEMVMSKGMYEASKALGFARKSPHLGVVDVALEKQRIEVPPESLEDNRGLLDPDVIGGTTGSRIMLRQEKGGYVVDTGFENAIKKDQSQWRENVLNFLKMIDPDKKLVNLAPIESVQNYELGLTDVFPPDFRIQLNFEGEMGILAKQELKEKISALRFSKDIDEKTRLTLKNLRVSDDSNPAKERYSLYLTPHYGYKARAVENIINNVALQTGIAKNELELLIAGDSFADIGMGLYGGAGTKATFLIVGGSRLTDALSESNVESFADESIKAIQRRLVGNREEGVIAFRVPLMGERRVILGDRAYSGKVGPESIISYLEGVG